VREALIHFFSHSHTQLITVNGIDVRNVSHSDVLKALQSQKTAVKLLVHRLAMDEGEEFMEVCLCGRVCVCMCVCEYMYYCLIFRIICECVCMCMCVCVHVLVLLSAFAH